MIVVSKLLCDADLTVEFIPGQPSVSIELGTSLCEFAELFADSLRLPAVGSATSPRAAHGDVERLDGD